MFLIPYDNWKIIVFLNKSLAITLNFFNRHVLAVFEMSDLKEVRILFLISTTKV